MKFLFTWWMIPGIALGVFIFFMVNGEARNSLKEIIEMIKWFLYAEEEEITFI